MDKKLPEDLSIYISMDTNNPCQENNDMAILQRDFKILNESK